MIVTTEYTQDARLAWIRRLADEEPSAIPTFLRHLNELAGQQASALTQDVLEVLYQEAPEVAATLRRELKRALVFVVEDGSAID